MVCLAAFAPTCLRINDLAHSVDVEPDSRPSVSWVNDARLGNAMQQAYELQVGVSGSDLAHWTSEQVISPASRAGYGGPTLQPLTSYWVKVRTWSDAPSPSQWSQPANFRTGPGREWPDAAPIWGSQSSNGWLFTRGELQLRNQPITWASLFATAAATSDARQFVYQLWLNQTFVGVGPTFPIGTETRYDGYDVTELLRPGRANAIGALAFALSDQRFLALLAIEYEDGSRQTFGTGANWKAIDGAIGFSDPESLRATSYYRAPVENIHAPSYPFGFAEPGFNDTHWLAAVVKPPFGTLAATPVAKVQRSYEPAESIIAKGNGDYFVDFGRSWAGGIRLSFDSPISAQVEIRYGEALAAPNTVQWQLAATCEYRDEWTVKPGNQTLQSWGVKVFRYLEILGSPVPITKANLHAAAYVYPISEGASFDSCDQQLNQVWEFSRHTLNALNLNFYVDSWTRERGAYEADAYLQQLGNAYLGADPTLGNYSIDYLIANPTWPVEWPMYLISAVRDSWLHTGSTDQLRAAYPALQANLLTADIDHTGLVQGRTGIVDWPASMRDGYVFSDYDVVVNSLAYRNYLEMSEIAGAMARYEDQLTYVEIAGKLRSAINENFYDPTKGAYRDGLMLDGSTVEHWAFHSSAFALAFGVVEPQHISRVVAELSSRGLECSPYAAAFYLAGLYRVGAGAIANRLLGSDQTNSWLHMINQGAGTAMEAWDPSQKPNLTYSHPWAASPAYLIPQGMLGIEALAPGFRRFQIRPQLRELQWATCTVPTVAGPITVSASQQEGSLEVEFEVPGNTTAQVCLPAPATQTTTTVYVDGQARPGPVAAGVVRIEAGPGSHVISAADSPRLT